MSHALMALFLLIFWTASLWSQPTVTQQGQVIGGYAPCTNGQIPQANSGIWQCGTGAAGTGAPTTSTYITQTPDGTLSAEQALSSLSSCLLANATGTGILTCYGGAAAVTNQFLRSLNALGAGTFSQVGVADLSFDPATQTELDAHTSASIAHGINHANVVLKDGSVAMDEINLSDMDATPVANRQLRVIDGMIRAEATDGTQGPYISKLSLEPLDAANYNADSIALGTKTTGNYIASIIAGTNITLSGCTPGESVNCTINSTGGGGGATSIPSAQLVTTTNVALNAEQTIDGVLTAASRVLVAAQITPTQNGVYLTAAGAWARTTDFDADAEFVLNTLVRIQAGTLNANTLWQLQNTSAVTVGSSSISFGMVAAGPRTVLTSQIDAANGVAGLRSDVKIKETELSSYAAHAALAAANSITVTALTMGIEGSGGAVDLTSTPQIVAGVAGQLVILHGTHATNTVKLDNGTGVRLCGNTGSAIVGLNGDDLILRYNTTLTVWEEQACKSLQRVASVGKVIDLTGTQLSLRDGTSGFDFKVTTGKPSIECINAGGSCDNEMIVPAGKLGSFFSNADELARITETTDSWDFMAGNLHLRGGTGAPTSTDCDAAGEARRVWVQTDASAECMVWTCRGAAGWANQCGVKTMCRVTELITAADDNKLFASLDKAITVKSAWCHYEGSAPSTIAQFQLVGMTHTPPTCAGPTAAATKQTVSAGNVVAALTPFRWSTTNTPNPATDTYELCVGYDIN